MGQVTQGADRVQIAGGPVGRPITRPPGNRFTQPRMQPVNPSRPAAPVRSVEDIRAQALRNSAPRLPMTRPGITNPNVSRGFGPAPLPSMPLTQPPVTGGPDPIPNWITPPPSDSMNAQVITPITNPETGEVYNAPNAGYGLKPPTTIQDYQSAIFGQTSPMTTQDYQSAIFGQAMPPSLFEPQVMGGQDGYMGPYTARPGLGPGRGFGVGLPASRGPGSQFGAALGTSSPMLNTVGAGFNPRGAIGATSGY